MTHQNKLFIVRDAAGDESCGKEIDMFSTTSYVVGKYEHVKLLSILADMFRL